MISKFFQRMDSLYAGTSKIVGKENGEEMSKGPIPLPFPNGKGACCVIGLFPPRSGMVRVGFCIRIIWVRFT